MRRRDFFAVLGGGIVVLLVDDSDAQEAGGGARRGTNEAAPTALSAWLHIGETGLVTVYTGKVEVGQNSRTALTQAAAEELRAPVDSIRLVMGDTALTPFDMGTFGSMTTPRMGPQIRKAAATAREMLLDLASQKWMVERSALSIANGKVIAGSRSAGFGELTNGQKLTRTIPTSAALTPAAEWKISGTSVPKVNGREIVTGAHKYAYDIHRPGMQYGKVLYPPSYGAMLVSLDGAEAERLPGVKVVREDNFAAVTAPDPLTAEKALAALKAQWKELTPETDSKDVYEYFRRTAQNAPLRGQGGTPEGTTAADPAGAPALATYTIAYIAHVPLEPRAAVAEWSEDKLTVWTGTQRPFGVRSELSGHFKIAEDQVHVIMPDTGSGYGGKHTGDAALEAARLSKAVGKPVQRNWTREEEMTWAYFRPGGVIDVGAKLNPDGTIAEWEFHNYNSGPSGLQSPYAIAVKREQYHPSKTPLRQSSYRGLAATANHFARECYMDDLALSAKMDPLEFRLKNTRDDRLRAVIQAAADKFGWRSALGARRKTAGHGFGIAAGFEKGGYVATCAEVSVTNGVVKVLRAAVSFECGAIVNPEHLSNQVEGAVAMGIGGALFEHIDFADNRILNAKLSQYRVPRFNDMPKIDCVLLDRKDIPSAGAGETPIVGIAPAIGNAIFDATGQRIRSLPLAPKGLQTS
jgi:nicotinate dehydrogenase subunit B